MPTNDSPPLLVAYRHAIRTNLLNFIPLLIIVFRRRENGSAGFFIVFIHPVIGR